MEIETARLTLRPVTTADTQAIADVVFSDPDVVGMLAHNTRRREDAVEEAARWTKVMGSDGDDTIWGDGGLGLFAVIPKGAEGKVAGVAGFYMERNAEQRWNGEHFYALGAAWHGRGLMTEVADVFGARLKSMPDLGVIYAGYWDMINEASGRLLLRTGLVPCGRKALTEEYVEERCLRMFDYDLWRLAECSAPEKCDAVAVQVARRAGAFVAENVIERENAIQSIGDAYAVGPLPTDFMQMFDAAVTSPGIAYLEIRGDGEVGAPVNQSK